MTLQDLVERFDDLVNALERIAAVLETIQSAEVVRTVEDDDGRPA